MADFTKEELKHKLEALLFSSGRAMNVEELSKILRLKDNAMISDSARELMKDYNDRKTSLMMVEESESWKITTREKFQPIVKKIVAQTEMSRTLIETLAVIAYKAPVTQSKIIDIRTNKAYDHIRELERLGFITSNKHSRTKMLRLSQKFFDYFDIDQSKLKERLGKNEVIEAMIKSKEAEIVEKMKKFDGDGEEPGEEKENEEEAKEEQKEKEEIKPEEKESEKPKTGMKAASENSSNLSDQVESGAIQEAKDIDEEDEDDEELKDDKSELK